MKTCNECRYALYEDYGHSNYTVEGTTFYCLKNAHPSDDFVRLHDEDERLAYAEVCPEYSLGTPVQIDVEREDAWDYDKTLGQVYADTEEVAELVDKWNE